MSGRGTGQGSGDTSHNGIGHFARQEARRAALAPLGRFSIVGKCFAPTDRLKNAYLKICVWQRHEHKERLSRMADLATSPRRRHPEGRSDSGAGRSP